MKSAKAVSISSAKTSPVQKQKRARTSVVQVALETAQKLLDGQMDASTGVAVARTLGEGNEVLNAKSRDLRSRAMLASKAVVVASHDAVHANYTGSRTKLASAAIDMLGTGRAAKYDKLMKSA